jgi:hypothetical protein
MCADGIVAGAENRKEVQCAFDAVDSVGKWKLFHTQ